jgi:two-component system sensor histidine kinase UhpB
MDRSTVVPIGAHTPHPIAHDAGDALASSRSAIDSASAAGADADTTRAPSAALSRSADEAEIGRLRARVRELAAEVVRAQESAQRHLAQELHDSAGAELTATRFALANLETWLPADAPAQCSASLAVAKSSLDAVSDATRGTIDALHAPSLDSGIVHALSHWTRSFATRTGLRTSFVCAADARLTHLPRDAALAIFRAAQEALNNVAKHAHASGADVRIESDAEYLTLVVADDGIGLPRGAARGERHFGLAGIRARCDAYDGELDILRTSRSKQIARNARPGTAIHARFAWRALLAPQSGLRRHAALS